MNKEKITCEQAIKLIADYKDMLGLPVSNLDFKRYVKSIITKVEISSNKKTAEQILLEIRDYGNQPEAFNQEGVKPQWKDSKWLPYNLYQRYIKGCSHIDSDTFFLGFSCGVFFAALFVAFLDALYIHI